MVRINKGGNLQSSEQAAQSAASKANESLNQSSNESLDFLGEAQASKQPEAKQPSTQTTSKAITEVTNASPRIPDNLISNTSENIVTQQNTDSIVSTPETAQQTSVVPQVSQDYSRASGYVMPQDNIVEPVEQQSNDIETMSSIGRYNDSDIDTFFNAYPSLTNVKTENTTVDKKEDTKRKLSSKELENIRSNVSTHVGYTEPIKDPVVNDNVSSSRYKKREKDVKNQAKHSLQDNIHGGEAISDKLLQDRNIGLDEVSVGHELIVAALNEPNSKLLSVVQNVTKIEFDVESPTFIENVIKAINVNNILVETTKSPVNDPASAQLRVLRVGDGRGIKIHPIQAKAYNADFDGDAMRVKWEPTKGVKHCMAYLIGITGDPKIDPDFFLVPQMNTKSRSEIKDLLKDFILVDSTLSNKDSILEAIVDICLENTDANWVNLINEISKGSSTTEDRYTAIAKSIKNIYDGMRSVNLLVAENISNAEPSSVYNIRTSEPVDQAIQDVLSDMQAGIVPLSFQEFKVIMNRYVGEIDGKNVHFRVGADIAKLVKYNKNIVIGGFGVNGENDLRDLYHKTMQMGQALRMSNLTNIEAKSEFSSRAIRTKIISEVGFPDQYETPMQFFNEFAKVYNKYSSIIRFANVTFQMNMGVSFNDKGNMPSINGKTLKDISTPFNHIYGEYTIERLFGSYVNFSASKQNKKDVTSNSVLIKYRTYKLNRFAVNNRCRKPDSFDRTYTSYDLNESTQFVTDFLLVIADKRTSTAAKYDEHLDKSLPKLKEILQELNKELTNKEIDWKYYAENITNLIWLFSPKMFNYYGMDNPEGFLTSKYGQVMLKAKDADAIGGIYQSMIIQRRLDRIIETENALSELQKREASVDINTFNNAIVDALNEIQLELKALSSSSIAWATIVNELRRSSANSEWNKLKNGGEKYFKSIFGQNKDVQLNAKDFWSKPNHYDSLKEFLLDVSVPRTLKQSVLSDVVRVDQKFINAVGYEMGYQLELDNSSLYSQLVSFNEQTSVLDSFNSFDNKADKFQNMSRETIQDNFDQAASVYRNQDQALNNTLKALTNDYFLTEISDDLFINAIANIHDKGFNPSEKGRQSPGSASIFSALVFQRGGVLLSDVNRADNLIFNAINPDQVSVRDFIRVIADPSGSEYFITFNEQGEPIYVNRQTIVGSLEESDLWNFFEKYPRLFMLVRQNHVVTYGDSKDVATVLANKRSSLETMIKANSSNKESVSMNELKSSMMDHYRFAAMVALFSKTKGKGSRTIRGEYKTTMNNLLRTIYNTAMTIVMEERKGNAARIGSKYIEEVFGLPEFIGPVSVSTDSYNNPIGIHDEIYQKLTHEIYQSIESYINEAVEIIKRNESWKYYTAKEANKFIIPDITSVAMYYDTKQELSGAKTQMSTGIEGVETYKTAPWIGILMHSDAYTDYDSVSPYKFEEVFAGSMTNAGIRIGEASLDEIFEAVGGEEYLIVETPENFKVQDNTLDRRGRQIPSIGNYLIVKRDKGAEELNLKVKKFGDDGTDSISKISKKTPLGPVEVVGRVEQAYKENGIIAARSKMAEILKQINLSMGYTDMTLANYASVAEYMVVERTNPESMEDTFVEVRSLEQIIHAIKNNIEVDLEDIDLEDAMQQARTIADSVPGITNQTTEGIIDLLHNINIPSFSYPNSVFREISSSKERNAELLNEIVERTGGQIFGENTIKKAVKQMKHQYKEVHDLLKSFYGNNYNFLGVVGDNPVAQPGPTTLWYIESGTDIDAIQRDIERARNYGITLVFRDPALLGDSYKTYFKYVIEFPNSSGMLYMLPFFDMELNGAASQSIKPAPGTFQAPASSVVFSFESSINEFQAGDAFAYITQNMADKIELVYRGEKELSLSDLFANTIDMNFNRNVDFIFEIADEVDVQKWIINEYDGGSTIDYGISDINRSFVEEDQRMKSRIKDFRENGEVQRESAKPDQIVAWIRCTIDPGPNEQYVLAPVIPFRTNVDNLTGPTSFAIKDVSIDYEKSSVVIEWEYNGGLKDQYLKFHEGAGSANKLMASLNPIANIQLKNGRYIDMVYAANTTASRRLATNKRLETLNTLMYVSRMQPYGYNFAEQDNSFPNNPELKEDLKNRRLTIDEWREILDKDENLVFHSDNEINTFVKSQVNKCLDYGTINPSDFLCSQWNGIDSGAWWEFNAMHDTKFSYQNSLMKYLNSMMPDLCPDSIEGDWSDKLFRPITNKPGTFEWGCLQMQVPHISAKDGSTFWTWENVYAGFTFGGDDFSGMSRPSINGSNQMMDLINTVALTGKMPAGKDLKNMFKWALASRGNMNSYGNISYVKPDIVKEIES